MRSSNTVLIVGAGICGLTTALSLARGGRRVQVFETRSDPRSDQASAKLAHAKRQAALANGSLNRGDNEGAQDLFDMAASDRSGIWGQRLRNLLFDHHSLEFLRRLGADTTSLPALTGFDTHLGTAQPSVFIRYGQRHSVHGSGRLDAATIMAQRDPVCAPAIGDVEKMLLAAAEAHSQISISFDTTVRSCRETADHVEVCIDDEADSVCQGALLILADGGGGRSLSHKLGIKRSEVAREEMNIAAFACDPAARLSGHSLSDAWLVARTTPQGWVVFLCSGKGRLTVNTRRVVGSRAPTALQIAREEGVTGALLEEPADFQYPLDRADEVVVGQRILLVGDAACRASPIWAFGAQFALLWAQMVGDLCATCPAGDCSPDPDALEKFRKDANDISRMRLEFESSVIELVDFANAGVRDVAEIAMSEKLFAALDEVELHFRSGGPGGGLNLRLGIDLEALIGASDKPDLAAFCKAVGRFDVDGAMALEFDANGSGTARADADRHVSYRTELEDIRMQSGAMKIHRDPSGYWSLQTSGIHLQRLVRSSGSDTSAGIERAEVRLPDAFVTDLLKQMGPRLWALGAIRRQPLQFEMAMAPGLMKLGSFELRLTGRPLARFTLQRQERCSRFSFELLRGAASVADFSRFLRASGLRATQLLRTGQRVFGSLADPFINFWAASTSRLVRKVDFKIYANGTGTAFYYFFGLAVPVAINKQDVERLVEELFDSKSCEQIMRHYQHSLISADVVSSREAI